MTRAIALLDILAPMSWASSRRTLIALIVASVLLVLAAGILIATFYDAPSCKDGSQNQGEEGIDCGGPCSTLCTPSVVPPVVSFVRELPQQGGALDVIAYVQNPNPFAATKNAAYEIEFLGENGTPVGSVKGKIDLPPAASVPVYAPNAVASGQFVREAFLTFDESSFRWYEPKGDIVVFSVSDLVTSAEGEAPRISAKLSNPSVQSFRNVKVIAVVFDGAGNAMAASQTVAASVPARSDVPVVFTWNAPFRETPGRIEIKPVYELP